MKILLAKRRAMGDTVFLSSTVENLKKAVPSAEIYALVPGAFASVLEGHPQLQGLFTYETGFFRLVRKIRSLQLDHFVQLHSSPSQRWLPRLVGAKKVSFSVQNSETEKAYGKHPNALEWDGFFLKALLGKDLQVPGPLPRIFLSAEEKAQGREYWKKLGVDPARLVFFGLGASRSTKRWPAANFARLAELLRDRADLRVAFITGPGEGEALFSGQVLDQLRAKALRPITSQGRGDFVHGSGLGVRALTKALSAVRAYVGNDSGPKHIAAAVGIPTFTFFGPEDPGEWHPYPLEQHPVFFRNGLSCRKEDGGRWCGLEECDLTGQQHHRCMMDLEPLDVFAELKKAPGVL